MKNTKSGNPVLWGVAFVLFAIIVIHILSRKAPLDEPVPFPGQTSRRPFEFVREQAQRDLVVYFIPGWMTKYSSQHDQEDLLRKIYPKATIISQPWESFRWWSSARTNADQFGRSFAAHLRQTHPNDLKKVVLVGHSLGGRAVIRTLNALGPNHHVNHAVLLGAAINYNDEELKNVGANSDERIFIGTKGPILNFYHVDDRVLQEAFQVMENSPALGRVGPNPPPPMGIQSFKTHQFKVEIPDSVYSQSVGGAEQYSEDENERALEKLFSSSANLDIHFQSLDSQIKKRVEDSNVQFGSPENNRIRTRPRAANRRTTTDSSPGQIDELAFVLQIDLPYEAMAPSEPQGFALTKDTTTSMIIGGVRAVMNLPSHNSCEYLRFFMGEVGTSHDTQKGFPPFKMTPLPPNRVN